MNVQARLVQMVVIVLMLSMAISAHVVMDLVGNYVKKVHVHNWLLQYTLVITNKLIKDDIWVLSQPADFDLTV